MATIYGRVLSIRHQNEGFCVFEMSVESAEPRIKTKAIMVSGKIAGLAQVKVGVTFGIVGDWVEHPKYGKQVVPFGWRPYAKTLLDVERFLCLCLDGFEDRDVVRLLIQQHGIDLFDVLSQRPDELRSLFGSEDPKRLVVDKAITGWQKAVSLSTLAVFLQDYDLGASAVESVFETFGLDAVHVISQNPYRLTAVESFTFSKADRVAQRVGISRSDPRRVEGAVLCLLRQESQQGHLFIRRGDLPTLLNLLMQSDYIDPFDVPNLYEAVMGAVDRLVEQKAVALDPNAGVYLLDQYRYEREGARKLAKFVTPSKLDIDVATFLAEYEKGHAIELSDAQREAVRLLIENHLLVLTGLPGTGKSTLIRAIVRLFRETGVSHILMAPTGIAAKRLASVTGSDAATIHRMVGYTGKKWGFNNHNKYAVGAVIIDEMSMVDQELFYRVLDALHPSTMLVLVGDDAQLPSVGPGNVLRELITCSAVPHVRLTQIFRQAQTSEIVIASHKINNGESFSLEPRPASSEFQFIAINDESQIADLVVKMAVKLKSRDANFQVLAPKYDGTAGVNNLNDRLREALNPDTGQKEWKAGKLHMRVGDRVMVIKNNYDLNVYNGDMGKLTDINKDSVTVKIHGVGTGVDTQIIMDKSDALGLLRLAYAVTVHKSQGSEFDTIILPLVRAHGRMRQRNLFYTAVTRAKKKCWVLGDPSSVLFAISNNNVVQRNTCFGRVVSDEVAALTGVVADL